MGADDVFFSLAIATVLSTPLVFRFIHLEWAFLVLPEIAGIGLTVLFRIEFR